MSYFEFLNKSNLKENSIKLYALKLKQLSEYFDINDSDVFSKDYDRINEYINNIDKIDNRLAFFNAIIKLMELKNMTERFDDYKEERSKLNKIKIEKYENNIKTDKFVEYSKLLSISDTIYYNGNMEQLFDSFLLFISIRYPMRLSLGNTHVVYSRKLIDSNKNYLLIEDTRFSFVMNNFKNVKSLGSYEFEIDQSHIFEISKYLKTLTNIIKNPEFLLYRVYRNEILPYTTSVQYCNRIKKLIKDEIGTIITMNDIRKSYETNLVNSENYKSMTNSEKAKEHKKLLHSHISAIQCYTKI